MGSSGGLEAWAGGSETWIVCQRRLRSACAGDVEVGGGVDLGRLGPMTLRGAETLSME